MYFLLAGLIGLAMKYFAIDPVASWDWWWVLSPFALAVVWWWWADAFGYTKRKEVEGLERRKQKRIEKQARALGQRR